MRVASLFLFFAVVTGVVSVVVGQSGWLPGSICINTSCSDTLAPCGGDMPSASRPAQPAHCTYCDGGASVGMCVLSLNPACGYNQADTTTCGNEWDGDCVDYQCVNGQMPHGTPNCTVYRCNNYYKPPP